MPFDKKNWTDRLTEHPGRFTYKPVHGEESTVQLSRAEGAVAHEGDAFDATNMNDLETRIAQGITEVQENLNTVEEQVHENLANTKAELNATIGSARAEAIETANAYTSERVNAAEEQLYDNLNSTATMLTGHIQEAKDMAVQQAGEYTDAQVQEALGGITTGDMQKAVYDTNNNGKVDTAEKADDSDKLAGQAASHYATATALSTHATSQNNPHGVTAAQTGAYMKAETDALLANKANLEKAPEWIDLPLPSGWENNPGFLPMAYTKTEAGWVTVLGLPLGKPTSGFELAQLPVGYRPTRAIPISISAGGTESWSALLILQTDGILRFSTAIPQLDTNAVYGVYFSFKAVG